MLRVILQRNVLPPGLAYCSRVKCLYIQQAVLNEISSDIQFLYSFYAGAYAFINAIVFLSLPLYFVSSVHLHNLSHNLPN